MTDERNVQDTTSNETDSWYCCRLQGWVPGMQVYHDYPHAA